MADIDLEEVSLRKRNRGIYDISSFNDSYLKNKAFFTSTYGYLKRNVKDISNLSGAEYLADLEEAAASVPKTEHFSYRNVAALENLVSSIDTERNQRRWLYHLWTSESNNVVRDAIDEILENGFVSNNIQIMRQEEISRPLEAFLRKNIQKITRIASNLNQDAQIDSITTLTQAVQDLVDNNDLTALRALNNNDFSQLILSASRNLAEEDFTKSIAVMSQLIERTKQWQSENAISFDGTNQSTWQRINERIAERYVENTSFNAKAARIEQVQESRGLKGFLKKTLLRGTPLTVEEIVRIQNNGTDFEKKQLEEAIKNFFPNIRNPEEPRSTEKTFNIIDTLVQRYNDTSTKDREYLGKLSVGLRIDEKGRIYTTADIEKGIDKGLAFIDSIFPFSMLHHKDMAFNEANRPSVYTFNAGTREVIASHYNNAVTEYLERPVTFVNGRLYDETGEEITAARGKFTLISSRSGLMKEYSNAILGTRPMRDFSKEPPTFLNWLQAKLDIDIHRVKETREAGSYTDIYGAFNQESKAFLNRQLEILGNIFNNRPNNYTREEVYKAYNAVAGLDKFINFTNKHTAGFSLDSLKKIKTRLAQFTRDSSSFDSANRILSTILELYDIGDDSLKLEEIVERLSTSSIKYSKAKETIASFMYNPKSALARRNVVADLAKTYEDGKYNSLTYKQMLIKDLSSELSINLREALTENPTGDNRQGIKALYNFYDDTLGFAAGEKAKNLDIATFLNQAAISGGREDYGADYIHRRRSVMIDLADMTDSTNVDDTALKEQISKLVRYFTDSGEDLGIDVKNMVREGISPMVLIGKNKGIRVNPLLLINQINHGHFERASKHIGYGVKDFLGQFISKYGDENFTEVSLTAWHIMNRINSTLNGGSSAETSSFKIFNKFNISPGLGLHSSKDMESSYAILKGLTLKRFLPVVGAFKAVEFIDDVLMSTTGTALTEAVASGGANLYLGLKKFTGLTGLDEGLKSISQDNAIIEYFAGFTGDENPEWKTYEEQKKYYEKGYSAVRKARFWTFGSANEFRGGKISYFEPNTLRLLRSDFRNESLYNGSFWTKYNPMRLIDRYYLENLHYNDRPYPVSGSLFEDSTPYGIVLNATIGDIIKPKILMHQDRLQDGVDVKALIAKINSDIRNKNDGNNLFVIKNGTLRAVEYTPFANPTPETSIETGIEEESIPATENFGTIPLDTVENAPYTNPLVPISEEESKLTTKDIITIKAAQGNIVAQGINRAFGSSLDQVTKINRYTREKADYNKDAGMIQEQKLDNYANAIDNMIDNAEDIEDVMNETSKNDYIQQSMISARMLTGFYGYMATSLTGLGDNKYRRIATSADMTSNSRYFWDSGIGGFGGDVMEIGRRFIPEYRRFQTVNPLMNEMPDWLPERFRFGDPYTLVPLGEARLPGRGYESLNELHPDIYGGKYGAFDRFKILADVAPTSAEYKIWRKIASKTVQDPELKEEMKEIRRRVREQNKQNDFAPYKYVGRDIERKKYIVSEVLKNGQFKVVGSNETYKVAGVRIKANEEEDTTQVLSRYIKPGQEVILAIDTNEAYQRNRDKAHSINAAIIAEGESLGEIMIKNQDAIRRASDISSASYMARHGTVVNGINYLSELVAHFDIPVIHNRWLNVNDPLEKYKDDYVYGTSFQSWDEPITSFIMPAMKKAATNPLLMGAGIISDILYNSVDLEQPGAKGLSKLLSSKIDLEKETFTLGKGLTVGAGTRRALQIANMFTDRASLSGQIVAKAIHLGASKSETLKRVQYRNLFKIYGLGYAAYNNQGDLAIQLMASSRLGYVLTDLFGGASMKRNAIGAGIGAAVGLMRWAEYQKLLAEDETASTFIPDEVRRKWEIEEYFDRLEYVKYKALFLETSQKAEEEEGVDIKHILYSQHREAKQAKKDKAEIKEYLRELENIHTYQAEETKMMLKKKLLDAQASSVPFSGGEYTKSAVMYYNAMRATMYALDETSQMTDIIRALPKTDREFFMEFIKERDEKKRKEILSYTSPQIRKALNMLWYGEFKKEESNEEYFAEHYLPSPLWRGWSPKIDLRDVKTKAIKNEAGLAPSDFGIYASQYNEPEVIDAPELNLRKSGDGLLLSKIKLESLLSGMGIKDAEISVEPRQDNAIQVIANVSRIVQYKIDSAMNGLL